MNNSPFSRLSIVGALAFLAASGTLLAKKEAPKELKVQTAPIVVENHMSLANEKGEISAPKAATDEEAFLIRRIAEFWKDGDLGIVKGQILEFFEKYPKCELGDYFRAILGDLYLQESHPDLALDVYSQIKRPAIYDKVVINKLHALYELGKYDLIVQEGVPFLTKSGPEFAHRKNELHFLVAEGLFRQAVPLEDGNKAKTDALAKAQPLYESLSSSPYSEVAQFALAEIYRALGSSDKAAALYLELAQKYADQKDELLFQAATLQAQANPQEAIKTFTLVITNKGKHTQEALFNRLVLLFKTGDYAAVLNDYKDVSAGVPESYVPTFRYVVGKSHYVLNQYKEASGFLKKYISSQTAPSDQLRNALLMQMSCAQKLGDELLFGESITSFQELFPQDKEIPKAVLMHSVMCKDAGNLNLAYEKLESVKEKFPAFQNDENFLLEYGYLSHQKGDWKKTYDTFTTFFKLYPQSGQAKAAWKLYFSSALHLTEAQTESYPKKAFFQDLQKVLSVPELFTAAEQKEYKLLYAKTSYELKKYPETLEYLNTQLFPAFEETDAKLKAEAHYLSALCLHETQKNQKDFCNHLEKAISFNKERFNTSSTHLHLFNGYASLADSVDVKVPNASEEKGKLLDNAAEHLHQALSFKDHAVKKENSLWLANHYYQKVDRYMGEHWGHKVTDSETLQECARRATALFADTLIESETKRLVAITPQTANYEAETLKLARLYDAQGLIAQKQELLSSLLEQQSTTTTVSWNFRSQALFELAQGYKKTGDKQKALETFSYLLAKGQNLPTRISSTASFEVAQIKFGLLDKANRVETNKDVIEILSKLKELQIRKHVQSEPVHFEAALEYVKVRSELAKEEEKNNRALFFLSRMKEDFASKDDAIGKEYHDTLEKFAEKKALFASYMKFVDAEIMRVQAKEKFAEKNSVEAKELQKNSLALLNDLKKDVALTESLYKRIEQSLKE